MSVRWAIVIVASTALSGPVHPGVPFPVDPTGPGNQTAVAVGADRTGRYVIAWEDDLADGDGLGIYARRFDAVAGALGTSLRVSSTAAGDQRRPAVALRDDGVFAVVWEADGQDASPDVFARVFAEDGSPISGDVAINAVTSGAQQAPDIAVGASGSFFVVWESDGQDGSGFGVYGRFLDAAGAVGGPDMRLADAVTGDQRRPAVDAAANGDMVIVWDDADRLFARRYVNGSFVFEDFEVPSLALSVPQERPDVGLRDDGAFLLGWWAAYTLAGYGNYAVRAMDRFDRADGDPQVVEVPIGDAWPIAGDLAVEPVGTAFATISSGTNFERPRQVTVKRFAAISPDLPFGLVAVDPHEPQGAIARLGGSRQDYVATWSEAGAGGPSRAVVYLVPLFFDGFETGDAGQWSLIFP